MLNWMTAAIESFGMKINIKSHLAYIKTCVGSPNAQIRGAALTLIGTLSMYSGTVIFFFPPNNVTPLLHTMSHPIYTMTSCNLRSRNPCRFL